MLHWIKGTRKRDPFVTNRITEIREKRIQASWSSVKSEDNRADLLTCGISAKKGIDKLKVMVARTQMGNFSGELLFSPIH